MAFSPDYEDREPSRAEVDALEGPTVLEFGAPWCGYCLSLQPSLAKLLNQVPDVRHIKIYDGKGQPLGRSFRVKLWPTLVFLRDGRVLMQLARPSEAEIRQGLNSLRTAPTRRAADE